MFPNLDSQKYGVCSQHAACCHPMCLISQKTCVDNASDKGSWPVLSHRCSCSASAQPILYSKHHLIGRTHCFLAVNCGLRQANHSMVGHALATSLQNNFRYVARRTIATKSSRYLKTLFEGSASRQCKVRMSVRFKTGQYYRNRIFCHLTCMYISAIIHDVPYLHLLPGSTRRSTPCALQASPTHKSLSVEASLNQAPHSNFSTCSSLAWVLGLPRVFDSHASQLFGLRVEGG